MRKALKTLPWVEYDSIQTNVGTRSVTFVVTDKKSFDLEAITKALKEVGFSEASLQAGPN